MKLVYRLILNELLGPFVFGVVAFTSVTFAGSRLLEITNWLLGGKVGIGLALELVLLNLPAIIVLTLPMSTLLAVLLGIGRLSGDSEIVALFAGGVSFYRMVLPVLGLGILISGSSIALNEFLVPWAHSRNETLRSVLIDQVAPSEGQFTVDVDELNLKVDVRGGIDVENGELRDVTVTQYAPEDGELEGTRVFRHQPIRVLYARRAVWEGLKDSDRRYAWKFYDGFTQRLGTDTFDYVSFGDSRTDEQEQNLGKTPEDFALYQKTKMRNTDQLSFRELTEISARLHANPDRPMKDVRKFEVNRWNKLALPLSSLVFALLAAPLGIRPSRSGSSVGFGLSILLILIYWVVWHFTSHLAIEGNVPAVSGAFAADVLGILVALALIRRATK